MPTAPETARAATPTKQDFLRDVLTNPHTRAILDRWPQLNLPDGWLVAGCLFQTIWNLRSGAPPDAQIKDYDIFYFDANDLTEEGEARVQARVSATLQDLGIHVEAKNQARVHLWYQDYFGHPYPRLKNSRDGIDRFLVLCTCVGLQPTEGGVNLYAHDLTNLYAGILQPNPLTDHRQLFESKVQSYRQRWPWLNLAEPSFYGFSRTCREP